MTTSIIATVNEFKLLLVGHSGVGKTTWLNRLRTGEFTTTHVPTREVETTSMDFFTNKGLFSFKVSEVTGTQEVDLYDGVSCVVVMFDLTDRESYDTALDWVERIRKEQPSVPIVVTGSKVDLDQGKYKVTPLERSNFFSKEKIKYYDLSAKSNYNFEKPFIELLRQLCHDDSIHFVEAPAKEVPSL